MDWMYLIIPAIILGGFGLPAQLLAWSRDGWPWQD